MQIHLAWFNTIATILGPGILVIGTTKGLGMMDGLIAKTGCRPYPQAKEVSMPDPDYRALAPYGKTPEQARLDRAAEAGKTAADTSFEAVLSAQPPAALAQPEPVAPRPLKERPDFIAGYREGLADRKRITEHEEAERPPAIQPVAPTDEELLRLAAQAFDYAFVDGGIGGGESEFLAFARAVLARWGTPANTINQEDYE
jgi:hypothetical protein